MYCFCMTFCKNVEIFHKKSTLYVIQMLMYRTFVSDSLREQLAHLYQAIHSSANTNLLQHYEEIIHSLISQSQDNRLECEQLETSIKR